MLNEILAFARKPVYVENDSLHGLNKAKYILRMAVLAIFISILCSIVIATIETFFGLELGEHAMDDFLDKYPPIYLFFFAVILAPLIEELLFRGPMVWFRNSNSFPYVFYFLTLAFGFMHISNFEPNKQTLLLSSILVSPQLFAGLLMGFVRVKFGLLYSMALHATYNLILAGPIFLLKLLHIPFE